MSTVAPTKRALVQAMRAHAPLVAAIAGGIHEAIAPRKVKYPFVVYQMVSAPHEHQFDGAQIHATFDISTYAENPVDANNVDALVDAAVGDTTLVIAGQTNMLCHRVAELPMGPDVDSEGRRIYQVGGSYDVWTDV
jgi:hypothetical protein